MISLSGVSMSFGRHLAVRDVTLDIPTGDSVALWGANGAGKTTLLRCVLGLLRYRGTITVGGHDALSDGKRARVLVGYVPQELGFYDDLGVAESVRFFGKLKGLDTRDANIALDRVGLLGHERKRIRELSGGMKQRLALAIALLGDPPVLVLDEVTASLDALGRADFVDLLARLSGAGRTMLFASHRVEEVGTLARRVVTLESGVATGVSPCEEFLARVNSGAVLHLVMRQDVRSLALRTLSEGGFKPSLNGVGILVPVRPDQKAAPFRVLAEARVAIDDFELVSGQRAASLAAQVLRHPESAQEAKP